MKARWPLHLALLCACVFALSLLFLQEPGFGDDLTYWTLAHDLHELGLGAWGKYSFHDLRWPVWGVCWLLQGIGIGGFAAYAGAPLLYVTAGAAVAFTFGRLISGSLRLAWACGIAFMFCPLLDTLVHRPMPDLSEGVWAGLTLLAWWRLMLAGATRASLGWAALVGLGVFLAEANRLTGVFIVPVLIVVTVLYGWRRFGWLVAAGGFAAFFYVCEMAFYHQLFGQWWHSYLANSQGKDMKGTEPIPFITSPFRFLDSLWSEGGLSPVYCVAAALGLAALMFPRWGRPPAAEANGGGGSIPMARVVAVWLVVAYLEYACAPQQLSPWQPVVRDAARFLAALAIPFSILGVLGVAALVNLPWLRARRPGRWLPEHPVLTGAACVLALAALTSREFFDLGFLRDMRAYVRKLPDGTKVFTHHMMRSLAIMADASAAQRLTWVPGVEAVERKTPASKIPREIMNLHPRNEEAAANADEFWYMHKIVWMNNRSRMEKLVPGTKTRKVQEQPPLASFLADTERDWALAILLVKGNSPELAFYRRRTPEMPPPVPLSTEAPELGALLPSFPATWIASKSRSLHSKWNIPANLRGKVIKLDTVAYSNEVESAGLSFKFEAAAKGAKSEVLIKPYTYPTPGRDFFLLPIPAGAERCAIQLKFSKAVKEFTVTEFQARVLTPLEGTSVSHSGKRDEGQ